jgi:exosome complex component CSL4
MTSSQQYTSRTPGEVIGREVDFVAGKGTYSWHHKVVASVVGLQHILPPSPDAADQRPTVEVRRQEEQGAVPEPGVVVTAKIRKVQPRTAVADVLCVGTRVRMLRREVHPHNLEQYESSTPQGSL